MAHDGKDQCSLSAIAKATADILRGNTGEAIRSSEAYGRSLAEERRMARLGGIEPPHPAPEAGALSPELQAPLK